MKKRLRTIRFKLSVAEDREDVKQRTFDAFVRAHGYTNITGIMREEKRKRNQIVVTYTFRADQK